MENELERLARLGYEEARALAWEAEMEGRSTADVDELRRQAQLYHVRAITAGDDQVAELTTEPRLQVTRQ